MLNTPINPTPKQIEVLRELARKYMEIASNPKNDELRELWRRHNSLEKVRVPVICSWFWSSNLEWSLFKDECFCQTGILLFIERWLRNRIFHATLGDDFVFEPWIPIRALLNGPDGEIWGNYTEDGYNACNNIWGEKQDFHREGDGWKAIPFIYAEEDIYNRLKPVDHSLNEEATAVLASELQDIFLDILPINIDRRSIYASTYGGCDISEALGKYIGIEQIFYMIYDKPEIIHKLAGFMQKAILRNFDQAEAAGDFMPDSTLNANMGVPYCRGIADPVLNGRGFKRKDMWIFSHGQEFTSISAKMHKSFLLDYQIPILEKFGLSSYACCEDVTRKIDMLRNVPNLRRIGVPPVSDIEKCAAQVGKDYVLCWRPNPAMVVAYYDEKELYDYIKAGIKSSNGSIVDIMLKDVTSSGGDPSRLRKWTQTVKAATDGF